MVFRKTIDRNQKVHITYWEWFFEGAKKYIKKTRFDKHEKDNYKKLDEIIDILFKAIDEENIHLLPEKLQKEDVVERMEKEVDKMIDVLTSIKAKKFDGVSSKYRDFGKYLNLISKSIKIVVLSMFISTEMNENILKTETKRQSSQTKTSSNSSIKLLKILN